MVGVVLSGGQSTRMGSDKGTLLQGNQTWSELALSKLASLSIPAVVSINKEQLDAYSKLVSGTQLVLDDESIFVKGPLLGLLSVHQKFPKEDLLIIACDMIDMSNAVLFNVTKISKEGLKDAYVYTTDEKPQPLCAVYTSKGLKRLYDLYQQKSLKKFSMMYALSCLEVKYIPAESSIAKCFTNYNSKNDLA